MKPYIHTEEELYKALEKAVKSNNVSEVDRLYDKIVKLMEEKDVVDYTRLNKITIDFYNKYYEEPSSKEPYSGYTSVKELTKKKLKRKEVVDLGGAEAPLSGAFVIDIEKAPCVDLVYDLNNGIPLANSSVTIFHISRLLSYVNVRDLASEICRTLRVCGEVVVFDSFNKAKDFYELLMGSEFKVKEEFRSIDDVDANFTIKFTSKTYDFN